MKSSASEPGLEMFWRFLNKISTLKVSLYYLSPEPFTGEGLALFSRIGRKMIKTESTRHWVLNFDFQRTKILYQKNLNWVHSILLYFSKAKDVRGVPWHFLFVILGGAYWGDIQYGRVSTHKEIPRCDMLAGPGTGPPGKFWKFEYSEMQSAAIWKLK